MARKKKNDPNEPIDELIVEMDTPKISNDAATSVGVEVEDNMNYRISTDSYDITMVYDDVILGEYVDNDKDEQGFKKTEGGLFVQDDGGENKTLYDVIRVLKIGRDVSQTKVGDLIVVSKTTGMQVMEFDGRESVLVAERNVFMQVKKIEE